MVSLGLHLSVPVCRPLSAQSHFEPGRKLFTCRRRKHRHNLHHHHHHIQWVDPQSGASSDSVKIPSKVKHADITSWGQVTENTFLSVLCTVQLCHSSILCDCRLRTKGWDACIHTSQLKVKIKTKLSWKVAVVSKYSICKMFIYFYKLQLTSEKKLFYLI